MLPFYKDKDKNGKSATYKERDNDDKHDIWDVNTDKEKDGEEDKDRNKDGFWDDDDKDETWYGKAERQALIEYWDFRLVP